MTYVHCYLSIGTLLVEDHPKTALCVWLWSCRMEKDPVLISCTNVLRDRQGFLMGLARPSGPCCCHAMTHPNESLSDGASRLLISTAVLDSSPARSEARAASSTGSEVVMSHTAGSHSTRLWGRPRRRPRLPARRQTVRIPVHSSPWRPLWLPFLGQWWCEMHLFSAQGINRKGTFPPVLQKWKEFSRHFLRLLQRVAMICEEEVLYYLSLCRHKYHINQSRLKKSNSLNNITFIPTEK